MMFHKRLVALLLLTPLSVMAFTVGPISSSLGRRSISDPQRLAPGFRQKSSSLSMMSKPLQLDADASFEEVVLKSEVPVLVDFHAVWCAPCKLLAPVMDEAAQAYDGKLKVVKVDCDTHKDLMNFYRARGLPMMAIFNKGELLKRQEGLLDFGEVGALVAKFVPEFKP